MVDEFGTRDVFEQVDTRPSTAEQDIRSLRTEVREGFGSLRREMNARVEAMSAETNAQIDAMGIRFDTMSARFDAFTLNVNTRFERQTRWHVRMMFGWLSVMASIRLKP